jgi:hypothetical protein
MAKIRTAKGEVLRVGAFDRWNNTAWQVDMMLDKDRLFVHPKISNPNAHKIRGYWWTSAAFRSTPKTRVVAPFTLALIEGPCVAFPDGAFGQRGNNSFAGPDLDGCGGERGGKGACAWQQDMSFMGNNPGHRDFFFQDLNVYDKPARPRITHVDDEGGCVLRGMRRNALLRRCSDSSKHADGCEGHTVLEETRKNNGTKFWPASFNAQMIWQTDFYTGEVAPKGCDQEAYDPFCEHNLHPGEYVELQNGPAPSQRHTFPVDARSTYEWTEYLAAFNADTEKLQDKDYAVANDEVTSWLESSAGVSAHAEDEADSFLASISGVPPHADDIMQVRHHSPTVIWRCVSCDLMTLLVFTQEAGPFGALQEELHAGQWGARAASGMPLTLELTRATRPWVELLRNGTFSKETLADLAPTSFMVEAAWVERLEESVAKHGGSWLHSLYLGTAALEMGNAPAAAKHFNASLAKQPSVHAERALAIFAGERTVTAAHYQKAWKHWKALLAEKNDQHVLELGRELATECVVTHVLTVAGVVSRGLTVVT